MMQTENLELLQADLCKVQAEITGAVKDSANPFFKSTYADLESCWSTIRSPLTKHGFSITQVTRFENGYVLLVTTLRHKSGQWLAGEYPIKPQKDDPQGWGSAISYARRYMLAAIIGLYQVDDDAESAMKRSKQEIKTEIQKEPKAFAEKTNSPVFNSNSLASNAPKLQANKSASKAQLNLLWARATNAKWTKDQVNQFILGKYKCKIEELPSSEVNNVLAVLQKPYSEKCEHGVYFGNECFSCAVESGQIVEQ